MYWAMFVILLFSMLSFDVFASKCYNADQGVGESYKYQCGLEPHDSTYCCNGWTGLTCPAGGLCYRVWGTSWCCPPNKKYYCNDGECHSNPCCGGGPAHGFNCGSACDVGTCCGDYCALPGQACVVDIEGNYHVCPAGQQWCARGCGDFCCGEHNCFIGHECRSYNDVLHCAYPDPTPSPTRHPTALPTNTPTLIPTFFPTPRPTPEKCLYSEHHRQLSTTRPGSYTSVVYNVSLHFNISASMDPHDLISSLFTISPETNLYAALASDLLALLHDEHGRRLEVLDRSNPCAVWEEECSIAIQAIVYGVGTFSIVGVRMGLNVAILASMHCVEDAFKCVEGHYEEIEAYSAENFGTATYTISFPVVLTSMYYGESGVESVDAAVAALSEAVELFLNNALHAQHVDEVLQRVLNLQLSQVNNFTLKYVNAKQWLRHDTESDASKDPAALVISFTPYIFVGIIGGVVLLMCFCCYCKCPKERQSKSNVVYIEN